MSDEGAPAAAAPAAQTSEVETKETPAATTVADTKMDDAAAAPVEEAKLDEPKAATEKAKQEDAATKSADEPAEKPDVEMKDAPDASTTEPAAEPGKAADEDHEAMDVDKPDESAAPTASEKPAAKSSKSSSRRKSAAGDGSKSKKLNKKASKANMNLHTDAKPGDHYFIKLKGFPQWPCIICDEDMLPQALLKSRPVSAARADGSYREDFADGGKQENNRTFPIMYLATNEFGWVSNKDLIDLDPEKVLEQTNAKMRKDLVTAHELAAEHNDLDYYKSILHQFQEEMIKKQEEADAKAAAAAAAAATPKSSKKKSKAPADDDLEMDDMDDEEPAPKKGNKRKNAEGADTPQRADSVKKPKIKLTNNNTTPKSNGSSSKSAKSGGEAKSAKKAKKVAKEDSEERVSTPKEPELSAEDRFERKKKEVLFLRHKLQKGLLTRDQEPKEDEMQMMSEYLTKLEGLPDLETEIIRVTKINKVLKAMLKLDTIPKEEEFQFKPRSQALLDVWNKLLAAEESAAMDDPNGVNGHKSEKTPIKEETKAALNGVKKAETEVPESSKEESKPEDSKADVKESEDAKEAPKQEAPSTEEAAAPKKEEVSSSEDKSKVDETPKEPQTAEATA